MPKEKLIALLADVGLCHYDTIADHLIANGVTVQEWISIEVGKLQNYIGVPVCIERKSDGDCWWAIIRGIKGDKVSVDYGGYFKLSEYGETWMVKYLPLPKPPDHFCSYGEGRS